MAARTVFYPPADTHTQRFDRDHPGVTFRHGIGVLVLHTEETSGGWPGYSSGADAPNMSCLPDMQAKVLRCRGHFPATMSARALVNAPGGVLTNTEDVGVFQIELAGTCSTHMVAEYATRGLRKNIDYVFWPEAPDWALREVARIIAWLHVDWGLPLVAVAPALWTDADRGKDTRMTFGQWIHFRGVSGHVHVPENSHRDPGAIDIDKVMRFAVEEVAKLLGQPTKSRTVTVTKGQTLAGIAAAAGITLAALLLLNPSIHDPNHITPGQTVTVSAGPTPTPTPKPTATPKPKPKPKPKPRPRAAVQIGSHGPLVRIVQRAVHVQADGVFGAKTQAAVKTFQRKHHLVPDGVVGSRTWGAISA